MNKARGWLFTGVVLGSALALLTALDPAVAAPSQDEPEGHRGFRAAKGRVTYRVYCANCHGLDAKGKGNLAQYLTVSPADLTTLSVNNGGEFPTELVHEIIDGRTPVRGHGGNEMPIWGDVFQDSLSEQAPTGSETPEARVRRKIGELVLYLETLQPVAEDENAAEE